MKRLIKGERVPRPDGHGYYLSALRACASEWQARILTRVPLALPVLDRQAGGDSSATSSNAPSGKTMPGVPHVPPGLQRAATMSDPLRPLELLPQWRLAAAKQ